MLLQFTEIQISPMTVTIKDVIAQGDTEELYDKYSEVISRQP